MNNPTLGAERVKLVTKRAAQWLLESGIQQPCGAVARYYRCDTQKMQPVSTEITAYAAATLVYLHRLTGDVRCLEAGLRAGRYLTRVAWNPALATIPFEGPPQELAYFFDAGIIARGLLALWRATGEGEFFETAAGCARSMAGDFRGPAGYHAILALPGKQPAPGDGRWSRGPGCYQLKAAMAWLDLGEVSLYEGALAGFLDTHPAFLEAAPDRENLMDRLHAYCYFLEGLLPRTAHPGCALALRQGIGRVGGLVRDIGPAFERCDVWAQLLRLRLMAAALGVGGLDAAAAEQEAAVVAGFQYDSADPRLDGGFCFGRKASERMPFANPASTAFSVQALAMWEQYQQGAFHPDTLDLI
jgi:hypothetical protein